MKRTENLNQKTDEETVIKVENLHKSFRLPLEHSSELKQHILNFLKGKKGYKELNVLRGINFEVKKGDFFGIVGRNGSGKSTLLKMLAGIYQPDKGKITTHGTIVPFIELGVGFNPELTGRENVYMNGAMLGFSNAEVDKMYDKIVDFAELSEFMDQKLKNYSSGMQVRLAFSIAIQAQGDILILDEVLAVGDEAFQRKCNDFFDQVKKDKTKTVILVTHGMDSVKKYCNKAILVHNGKIEADSNPNDVANKYTQQNIEDDSQNNKAADNTNKIPIGLSKDIPKFKIKSRSGRMFTNGDSIVFDVEYQNKSVSAIETVVIEIDNTSRSNTPVILDRVKNLNQKRGEYKIQYKYSLKNISDGDYVVIATLRDKEDNMMAFTSDVNALKFAIRTDDKESKWPLLREKGEVLRVVKK